MNPLGELWSRWSARLGARSKTEAVAEPPRVPSELANEGRARNEFKQRCLLWASGLKPTTSATDDERQKVDFARSLSRADLVAHCTEIASWTPQDADFRALSLMAFVFSGLMHQVGRGEDLARAIVAALNPQGPPLLVDMWGEAQRAERTPELLQALDWRHASAELQIALAGALLTTRAVSGVAALREMKQHPQSPAAEREIDVALRELTARSATD